MKIGIDIDGVCADFCTSYADLLRQTSGRDLLKDGWFANNTVWDWDAAAGYSKTECDTAWNIIKTTDFWFNLEPLPGVEDGLDRLNELSEVEDIYFITHRVGKECKQQTEDWLFRYGITTPTVLIAGMDKTPLVSGLNLDIYIDDKLSTMQSLRLNRQPGLYLKDAPYNQSNGMYNITRVKSLNEMLDIIGDR